MSTAEPDSLVGPIQLTGCSVDPVRRGVSWDDGRQLRLTGHEAGTFIYLAERPGVTVPREDLLEHVWGYRRDLATRAVDNTISRLRAKIEQDTKRPQHLLSLRGKGYSLVLPACPAALTPADFLEPSLLSPLRSHMGGATAPEGEVAIGTAIVHQAQSRWDTAPEAMAECSEQVDRLLRGALSVVQGYEVKSDTSGFMAAFPSAGAAVAWAVGAQSALAEHTWPEGFAGLQVCSGLDLGAPIYRRDPVTGRMEYFGPMVNRSAQLARQARPGEVLGTARLVESAGSRGPLGWTQLGARELVPGSGVATGVSQLVHAALAIQAELPADQVPRTNLPEPDRAFTGRRAELAALSQLLAGGARWTTVLGPAGVGKSRLVQEAARRWLPRSPGGVWWCDLSAIQDIDGLLSEVARTLGLSIGGDVDSAVDELGRALAALGPTVLILDNLEALVPSCTELIEIWLRAIPSLQLVATSQVAAQASTEELLRLAPMGREDGVQLLALRARESHRGFVLDSQSRPLAEQIVDALDGIPLAIELAGARMHMLGPRALLERLSDRFKILRARRSTSRHSTLWDAIDWSWRLLAPAEQAALAQCSVFAGGFDLTAAESVIGLPESDWTVLDAIEGLREHSLLQLGESPLAPGVPRFRLLSSVRAFAAVHLAELDAHGQAAERHCAYFVEAVLPLHRTVGHADHGSSLSLVELELPNLIASMNHALKHQPDTAVDLIGGMRTVFFLRGPRHRTAGLLDRLDLAVLSPKKQATALAFRAIGLMDVEDMSGAEAALQSARAAAVESGEPGIQAYVLMRLGDLCRHQGQSEPAEQYYAQTRGLARDAGDSHTEISALRRLGMLARARDDAQTAMSFCEEALAAAEASGAELLGASVCNSMGLLLMDSGQLDAAQHRFEQTLAVAEGAGARGLVVSARANLGVVLVRRGEPAEAMLLLKQAREEAEAIDHKMVLAQVEECIAEAELALG